MIYLYAILYLLGCVVTAVVAYKKLVSLSNSDVYDVTLGDVNMIVFLSLFSWISLLVIAITMAFECDIVVFRHGKDDNHINKKDL